MSNNICWLKITDYMRGWARHALGSGKQVFGEPVLRLNHLPGAREAFMMEAAEELPGCGKPGNSVSATWMNALQTGVANDAVMMEYAYDISREMLKEYLPVACPEICVGTDGIIRPWSHDTAFGEQQSTALQKVVRNAFWRAVRRFSFKYARRQQGRQYPQIEMIEAFCKATHTDDIYAEAMRREWQRRCKREKQE